MAKYAVLSYTTPNIGDDMQSLETRRFVPDAVFLKRERLNSPWLYLSRYRAILNGWFLQKPDRWPPVRSIDPLVISFHLSDTGRRAKTLLSGSGLEWFKRQAKRNGVGARDLGTLKLFREAGVDAYFSGCLTMTMRPPGDLKPSGDILMIDVDERAAAKLSSVTHQPFRKLTQLIPRDTSQHERFALVNSRFRELCEAKAVVTSRIHVAFPCLAVGTPVLMVHPEPDNQRFVGIVEHLNFATPEDVLAGRYDFNFDKPPANKETHHNLVKDMERRCEAFVGQRLRPHE